MKAPSEPSVLNVSLLIINGEQRLAYQRQIEAFERRHPDIQVKVNAVASEEYKDSIEDWLQAEAHSDVMFWFGGERLNWYVRKGWIRPLDDLWTNSGWQHRFTSGAQSAVTRDGRVYGLPIHYYYWGIFYRKSLFARLDLQEPRTWPEFLQVCASLKQAGVIPIAFGSREVWPVGGWFDYLNLRLNGLDFHQALVSGSQPYRDDRVEAVFRHWQVLVDRKYLQPGHEALTWRETLPFLYRNLAGMFLMGSFWTTQAPESLLQDIGVFRFPVLDPAVPRYEEAPTDVLIIPRNVRNPAAAEQFLTFLAEPAVQHELNEALGMLAPRSDVPRSTRPLLQSGQAILDQAAGAAQYYDRDNPQPIATEGMKLMQRFLADPAELPHLLEAFDELREQSFTRQALTEPGFVAPLPPSPCGGAAPPPPDSPQAAALSR